jgi:hypothetical protein
MRTTSVHALVFSILATGISAAPAAAIDSSTAGLLLQVKNPSTPERRAIKIKTKPNGFGVPLSANPAALGATLGIRAEGATPSEQLFSLPIGSSTVTGKPFWTEKTPGVEWRYDDPAYENGPVRKIKLKRFPGDMIEVQALLLAKKHPIDVVPPNPGTAGCARLEIGSGADSISIAFTTGGVSNNGPKLFKVVKAFLGAFCDPFITTSTSTTTTTLPCSSGTAVGGACWFLSAPGASCTATCTAEGLTYDEATRTYAGSDGTDAGCGAVSAAVHGVAFDASTPVGTGSGCFVRFDLSGAVRNTSPTTTAGAITLGLRYCACM